MSVFFTTLLYSVRLLGYVSMCFCMQPLGSLARWVEIGSRALCLCECMLCTSVRVVGGYVAYLTLQQREGGKERRALCVCLVITLLDFVV